MKTDNEVRQAFLLSDNTFKVEGLKVRFTELEIDAANNGESNAYSQALNELLAQRAEIQAMDIS